MKMFGLPVIDVVECLRDSPVFRENLECHEKNLDSLENKLEKIVKQCTQMVNAGRVFNQEQEQLVHAMWELSCYFSQDTAVQGSLNCLLDTLREAANYQKMLIDQAARSIIKKFTEFNRIDIKSVKEKRHWFEKASLEMDSVLQRSSSVTKVNEGDELNKQVWATRQAFRHTAIDYMHSLSITQAKKRHEVVDAILSYTKAYNTFYHQGSDLFDDTKEALDKISSGVNEMRSDESDLEKSMENRHFDISGKDLVILDEKRNSSYPVSMQGYLFKRTNNAFKSWVRRYFVLSNHKLYYRKRSGEETTVMEEDLKLCSVKPAMDVERRFCLEITSNTKSHVLQAESEESCQKWIECLIRGISSALQQNDYTGTQSHFTSSALPSPANSPMSLSSPSAVTPDTNRNKLWNEILSIPGNKVCCDCGSSDPKWASINIGITLCIECSGIHRSLGVHYSKVRSLTLDKWDFEVIRVMERLGNDVINQIYLSNYRKAESVSSDSSSTTLIPAAPGCDRQIRESWIKAKYIERLFVAPLNNERVFHKILRHRKTYNQRRQARKGRGRSPQASPREVSPADEMFASSGEKVPLHLSLETALRLSVINKSELQIRVEDPIVNLGCAINLAALTPDELLLHSSRICHLPLMCFALTLGAKKNVQDHEGKTALHYAVFSKCAIAIEYLLLNGLKVDAQDSEGKTALHESAIQSNILQVYRLIKYRADWKITDNNSQTAIDYALESNEPDLVTLLRVATLSDQLDKEDVEEEMASIIQELYRKKSPLLVSLEDNLDEDGDS